MWPFKPKLKLNFYDPEYDDLMNLFKQMNYVSEIVDALEDASDNIVYVTGLLDAFVSIYDTAGKRIRDHHKRKLLDFDYINWEKMAKDLRPFHKTIEDFKQMEEPRKKLMKELHGLRREQSFNKIVSETYVKVFMNMTYGILRLSEFPSTKIDTLCNLYGKHYIGFLAILRDNMKLYRSIGTWLKQDKKAIAIYKPYLIKRIITFNALEKRSNIYSL